MPIMNINELLKQLKSTSTPEDIFTQKLAEKTPAEPVAVVEETPAEPVAVVEETPAEPVAVVEETPAEPNVEITDPVEVEDPEAEEKVAEWINQGRIMARAYYDELTKIASSELLADTEETSDFKKEAQVRILTTLYKNNFGVS